MTGAEGCISEVTDDSIAVSAPVAVEPDDPVVPDPPDPPDDELEQPATSVAIVTPAATHRARRRRLDDVVLGKGGRRCSDMCGLLISGLAAG